jgi:hypothetical protein
MRRLCIIAEFYKYALEKSPSTTHLPCTAASLEYESAPPPNLQQIRRLFVALNLLLA